MKGENLSRRDFLRKTKNAAEGLAATAAMTGVGVTAAEALGLSGEPKEGFAAQGEPVQDATMSETERIYRDEKKEMDRIKSDFQKALKDKDTKRQMELLDDINKLMKRIDTIPGSK